MAALKFHRYLGPCAAGRVDGQSALADFSGFFQQRYSQANFTGRACSHKWIRNLRDHFGVHALAVVAHLHPETIASEIFPHMDFNTRSAGGNAVLRDIHQVQGQFSHHHLQRRGLFLAGLDQLRH
ncbi:MAG TPA: hypothetical protein VHP14_15410, partial [Anaerolineales bacterium]|nr:hypothetical protein [Anaerolineales bacterium]